MGAFGKGICACLDLGFVATRKSGSNFIIYLRENADRIRHNKTPTKIEVDWSSLGGPRRAKAEICTLKKEPPVVYYYANQLPIQVDRVCLAHFLGQQGADLSSFRLF